MCHGRPKETSYLHTPDIDRWRGELEEMADWLDLQVWPQPEIDPQPDDVDTWQDVTDRMDILGDQSGRSTPTSNNFGL